MSDGAPARLRELLASGALVVAPGVPDALSARLARDLGFPALYVSGAGTAAARGLPDMGVIGAAELVDATAVLAGASGLPAIVDADTGFGGPAAVRRTVRALLGAGAAAIQIEDQRAPKRCGYMEPEECVPIAEMVARLRAARAGGDAVLVARTDALGSEGLEAAIARGRAYLDAGADLIMVNGITRADELRRLAGAGFPQLYNHSGSDAAPWVADAEARALGIAVVIHPIQVARAMAAAARAMLGALAAGRPPDARAMLPFREYMDLAGWAEAERFERDVAAGPGR